MSVARLRGMGVFLVLLGLISLFGFGLGVPAGVHATFLLSSPAGGHRSRRSTCRCEAVCIPLAVVCALLGGWLIAVAPRRGSYAIFGVGVVVFTWSFLVWAARGG